MNALDSGYDTKCRKLEPFVTVTQGAITGQGPQFKSRNSYQEDQKKISLSANSQFKLKQYFLN